MSQLELPFLSGPVAPFPVSAFSPTATAPPPENVWGENVHDLEWKTLGICRGCITCLCGQLELSDSPLWNESE